MNAGRPSTSVRMTWFRLFVSIRAESFYSSVGDLPLNYPVSGALLENSCATDTPVLVLLRTG
jgi:hypothetical protein